MASIEKRGVDKATDKEVWRLVAYGPASDGKRKKFTDVYKGSEKKARKAAEALEIKVNAKGFREESKETFAELSERWLKLHGEKKARKTVYRYRELAKRLVKYLGDIPVEKIEIATIEDLYTALTKEPRQDSKPGTISLATVWHHHRLLHQMLQYAVELKIITSNPCSSKFGKPAPIEDNNEETFFDQHYVDEIISRLEKEPLLNRVLVNLALDSGCRAGELMALTWQDIDSTKGMLNVNKAAQCLPGEGSFIKQPKSARGVRIIPLCKSTLSLLEQFEEYQKEVLDMDIIKSVNVFCDTDGKALHPEYASHWWGKFIQRAAFDKVKESYWSDTQKKDMPLTLCKKTDIPQYGIHSLRHTCGSILLSKGYSPAAVAKRLGHRVETLMKIYNHALRDDETMLADAMDDILSSKKTEETAQIM